MKLFFTPLLIWTIFSQAAPRYLLVEMDHGQGRHTLNNNRTKDLYFVTNENGTTKHFLHFRWNFKAVWKRHQAYRKRLLQWIGQRAVVWMTQVGMTVIGLARFVANWKMEIRNAEKGRIVHLMVFKNV